MNYSDLQLEKIVIPADAEQRAQKGYSCQYPAAPGIFVEVTEAKDGRPAFCYDADGTDGLKYFITIGLNEKKIAPLTKAIKKIDKNLSWMAYLCEQIDRNPALAASTTAFAYEWEGFAVYLWTRDKSEFPLLCAECSKAIAGLVPDPGAKFDGEAAKALVDEKGLAAFEKCIRSHTAAMSKYRNLPATVDAVMARWTPEKLLSFLVATACVEGFSGQLKELAAKHGVAAFLEGNPEVREELFFMLQESLGHIYVEELTGLPTKEYIGRFIALLAGALDALGFEVHPKGIEVVIRCFANASVEGIGYQWYRTATGYDPEEFGYYDGIENEKQLARLWAGIDVTSHIV